LESDDKKLIVLYRTVHIISRWEVLRSK